jgi:hypothetical protein
MLCECEFYESEKEIVILVLNFNQGLCECEFHGIEISLSGMFF